MESQDGVSTDPKKLAKIIEGKQAKAVSLLYKRDVLMEQDLATSSENISVDKYLKGESKRLGADI